MSEAQTDSHPVVGTHLAGLLGGSHPACRSCGHVHRITAIPPSKATCDDVTYDAACPQCPCTANGDAYDHGVVDITPNFDDHHFRLELAAGVGGGAVERFDIDEYPRLVLHPDPRVGRSLQRADSSERSVRDPLHDLDEPWPLRATMAVPAVDTGPSRPRALWPLRLVALVKSLFMRPVVRSCWSCGCTDDHACPGGCWWVDDHLCSACTTSSQ